MGKNRGSGAGTKPPGTRRPTVRVLTAAGALAVSFSTLNLSDGREAQLLPAVSGTPAESPAAPAGKPVPPGPGSQAAEPAGVVLRGAEGPDLDSLPHSIPANPQAVVSFPRPVVTGSGPERPLPVEVGYKGVGRPAAGYLMAPLEVLNPSSPFGFRISPLTGTAGDFHLGQDYAAPCGTGVYAADSGVVRAAGWHPWGGGNRVEIDHGNGLVTTYNHLESLAVRRGDSVQAGQVVGRVGSTGWSTGCHLHFETILNGWHVSPLKWQFVGLTALAGGGLEESLSYAPGSGSPADWLDWTLPGIKDTEPTVHPAEPELPTHSEAETPSTSPTEPAPSPTEPTPAPTEPSASPTEPSPSPTDPTASPTEPTPAPTEPSASPTEPSPSPTDPTASPTEPTPAPTEPSASPTEPLPSPSEPSPWPVEPAPSEPAPTEPVPTEPVPAPVEPVPTEPVPAPVEPAPSEPVPAPVEPAPTEPAPAPVEPAPTEPLPTEPAPAPTEPAPIEPATLEPATPEQTAAPVP
jgi:murein DD-endopeptidase MepM/ murein hydrolase activator NlpD